MHHFHRRMLGRVVTPIAIMALASWSAVIPLHGEPQGKRKTTARQDVVEAGATDSPEPVSPVVQLIRDPHVQDELKLTRRQAVTLEAAYAKIEQPLWLARDYTSGPRAAEKAQLASAFATSLAPLLEPAQRARLRQLELQARGWPALKTAAVAGELDLTLDQMRRIGEVLEQTQQQMQKAASSSQPASEREQTITRLRTEQGTAIQNILSRKQTEALAGMVGESYDLSRIRPLTFTAPELKQVDDWINSQPLTNVDLQGKVVAFHFWAFGCINCVHNLPHYNKWQDQFSAKGLLILGMHTPETAAERNVDTLRKNIGDRGIRYAVAVDHEGANWAAWANSMWPSVYLVDKRGKVRYWWYGELNWQGSDGEKFIREKIQELLAEKK